MFHVNKNKNNNFVTTTITSEPLVIIASYCVILTNVIKRFKLIKGSMGCYALITLSVFILLNIFTPGQSALVDKDHWVCVLAARRPQNYILPHPDCTKFHVCQFLGGTRHSAKSWKAHIFNCPATTGFDELLKVCNHLYNLKQRNGRCGKPLKKINYYI